MAQILLFLIEILLFLAALLGLSFETCEIPSILVPLAQRNRRARTPGPPRRAVPRASASSA